MSSVNLVARFGLIAVFLFAPIISADLAGSGPDIDTPADNTEYSETTWIGCDGSCSDPATLKLQFKQSSLIVQERVFMNVFETPSWLQNVEP
ncbi:hypothetical protein FF011L_24770 [Roseimaritima multifibrata]|uniref:Uncharacterized protein n=1 Tax=Roseimaritima multifibrata TaxID=1930274 RepID=A0A517MFN1_9BACT|nr:hypothetical protein [Roseimaritima multifibrata]QDS93704.1 hypothetical protein FF011L_24770 [Roseimaritima multifibrata]